MSTDKNNLPKHIAIIMDGNGRWARKRGLPRTAGHRAGINSIKRTIKAAKELGIKVVSFFAFSTENWNRPKKEIAMLMSALNHYLENEISELMKNDIKLIVSGKTKDLPQNLQHNLSKVIDKTGGNKSLIVNFCLNYGGRSDIVQAANKIIKDITNGKISQKQINEDLFSNYLYTGELPDPDLLIRTSGELRISNFLLWQLSYTELYFPKTYWPDFGKKDLILAIKEYQSRQRRFGRIK